MSEIPEHLLRRTANYKEAHGQTGTGQVSGPAFEDAPTQFTPPEAANIAQQEAIAHLPEACRDCRIRPEEAGGNGTCDRLNGLVASLGNIASGLENGDAIAEILGNREADGFKHELTSLKLEAGFKKGDLIYLFSHTKKVLMAAKDDVPAPHGVPVELCAKPLVEMFEAEHPTPDITALKSAAVVINSAYDMGLRLAPPLETEQ